MADDLISSPVRLPSAICHFGISRFGRPECKKISQRLLLRLPFRERLVEEPAGGLEAHLLLDEAGGLGGAVFAVHAGVFPLDGKRAGVADLVEDAGDGVEIDLAAARRAEVPAPSGVAEVQVRAEDPALAVERSRGVL